MIVRSEFRVRMFVVVLASNATERNDITRHLWRPNCSAASPAGLCIVIDGESDVLYFTRRLIVFRPHGCVGRKKC